MEHKLLSAIVTTLISILIFPQLYVVYTIIGLILFNAFLLYPNKKEDYEKEEV